MISYFSKCLSLIDSGETEYIMVENAFMDKTHIENYPSFLTTLK